MRLVAELGRWGAGALDSSVHGRAGDLKEVSYLGRGVSALPVEVHEVAFLRRREFGLFAAESSLGFRDSHGGFSLSGYRGVS